MIKTSTLRYCIVIFVCVGLLFSWQNAFTNSGSTAGGYTNAPGESNCTSCHTGSTISAPSGLVKMTVNGASSYYYEPDSTYIIAISATKSSVYKWGYQATALKDSDKTFSGTFASINLTSKIVSASISGKTRYYAEQTTSGTSGTGGRSWSFSWKAPHTYVGGITFYVTTCAADGNSLATFDQIYGNTFTLFLKPNVPVAGFTFSPVVPCENDTVYVKDTSTKKPTSWSWSFPGGTPASSTLQNPKVVYKAWGGKKMTLVATNKDGASSPVTRIIIVNQKPLDTIYRFRPLEFCFGDSTILRAYIGDRYLWSTGDTNQVLVIKKSGTYYCTVTSNGCSTRSKSVKVIAHAKPTNKLSRIKGGDTLCDGDTLKFRLLASGKTWNYYLNKTLLSNSGPTLTLPNLSGNNNKIYTLVIDSFGCKSDTSTVYRESVNARLSPPVLTAGKSTTQSVSLSWTAVAGAKGYDISTDSGKTWQSAGNTFSYTKTGINENTKVTIKVRAQDPSPCAFGKEAIIVLQSLACLKITYSLVTDSLVCPKTIAGVNFSNINSNHYGISLGNFAKRDTVYSFYLINDTILHFKIADSLNLTCGVLAVDVPLKTIKYAPLKINADQGVYCGNSDPATIKGNGIFEEYDVYDNGKLVQNGISNTYSTNSFKDGDRIVMIGVYRECRSDSSNPVILHKYEAPTASFNYKNTGKGIFNFINTSKSEYSRVWHFGDGTTDTAPNPTHTYAANKIYTVWLVSTGQGGCKDSISKTITSTGIHTGIDPAGLNVQPNPFNNEVTISFYSKTTGFLNLVIVDLQGRAVKTFPLQKCHAGDNQITLLLADIKPGQYLLRIEMGDDVVSRRLVKE
jgi:PKD repeat protein